MSFYMNEERRWTRNSRSLVMSSRVLEGEERGAYLSLNPGLEDGNTTGKCDTGGRISKHKVGMEQC